jgi:hypothetical protein
MPRGAVRPFGSWVGLPSVVCRSCAHVSSLARRWPFDRWGGGFERLGPVSLSFSRPRGTWRPLPSSNGPLAAAVLASSRAAALPPPSSFGPGESVSE